MKILQIINGAMASNHMSIGLPGYPSKPNLSNGKYMDPMLPEAMEILQIINAMASKPADVHQY